MTLKAVPPLRRITLANARTGKLTLPLRVLGYGPEGVGKSTFAAGAPKPCFVNVDKRTAHLDVMRLEPANYSEILECFDVLDNDPHGCESVVLDPLTWIEPMVWEQVTGPGGNIDKYDGGFGRGHGAALAQWRMILSRLERLWLRGMHVILLAHSIVKPFNDPEGPGFDRYEVALNARAAGLFKQWVDYVLFMRFEAFAKVDGSKKPRGISTGARMAHTSWQAAFDAKRSLPIPDEIPLSWAAFTGAIESSRSTLEAHKQEIAKLLAVIGDAGVTKRATADVASAGDDVARLAVIANALAVRANEIEAENKS